MTLSKLLESQTALVTGASRGIGKAIAILLAKEGAEVIINYSSSLENANKVVSEINSFGGKAYPLQADISNENSVNELVKTVLEKNNKIDVLVNNAGITKDGLLMRMKTDDWQKVLDLNLSGVFYCTRAVSRQMLKQRKGRIINITSVVGLMGNPGQANYSAAKAGVVGLTQSAAKEFASRGITVNAVAPGFIKTEILDSIDPEKLETMAKNIPVGRIGDVKDISSIVYFLASDEWSYITGQVLHVNGGLTL